MQALTRIVLSAMLILSMAGVAFAQASINDCEKIQAADAYNRCLAKFGPPSKEHNLEPERPGDVKSSSADAAASALARGRGKGRGFWRRRGHAAFAHRGHGGGARKARVGRGGRKTMTIQVGK